MEFSFIDSLKAGGASATLIAVAVIVYKLSQHVCGHRLRSDCCGRRGTIGITVDPMPPPSPDKKDAPPAVAV